jgi:hypothetical protein
MPQGNVSTMAGTLSTGAATNCQLIASGSNTVILAVQDFTVSGAGTGNLVRIENGATMTPGSGANTTLAIGSSRNSMIFSSGALINRYTLSIRGSENTLLATGNGTLVTLSANVASLLNFNNDFGNVLTVADNAVVTNLGLQLAASSACSNRLIVTSGGKVFSHASIDSIIASGSNTVLYGGNTSTNSLIVTGAGSVWNQSGRSLYVCAMSGLATGTINRLVVEAGALVTNVNTLAVAIGTNAMNNSILVNGGLLQATSLCFSNSLPNGFTLTGGGWVSLVNLFLTNANHTFAFAGGTLNVRNTLATGGLPFIAGDGAQTAVLNLLPGAGTNLFADGLVITNTATLAGAGLLQATGTIFGTLSPGAGVGIFTNNGAITLKPGATTRIELAAYTAPGAGWDCLAVTNGALQLDGTLSVQLNGSFMPTNTQRFLIMTNQGPAGVSNTFANLQSGTIPAATNWGGKAVGLFQVKIGPQGVVLDSFTLLRTNPGSLIMIR